MTKWLGPAAWNKREARGGDRLPYARHIDASTLRLRDGSLMRCMRLAGFPFETEDDEVLNHLLAVRDVVLRSALNSKAVLYHHLIRRRVEVDLQARSPDAFSADLDRRWKDQLNQERLFLNEQFLTIVIRPPRGKAGLPERLSRLGGGKQVGEHLTGAEALELDSTTAALSAALQSYGVRVLGTYETETGIYSEPLELLSALYNGEMRPVLMPRPEQDLGQHIPYARVSFGLDAIEVRGPGRRGFASILGIKEYPDSSRAGLLDSLLRVPHELVITESFAPIERQTARERIDLSLRRLRSADEGAATERAEMLAARDAVGAGQLTFGDHHLSLLVRSPTLETLETATADAAAALADIGAVAVREDVNLEPAFWGQFPGNEQYVVRRALISSSNAAGFISLHGFPMGRARGNHWGDAVTTFETTSSTPYFFNFHEGDLGNFTIIGPSGSGKTVVLNFLAAQAQKFSPRTILFDKDRGSEIFLRALGGRYERINRGAPTGFNPLRLPDEAGNRAFLRDWLSGLLEAKGEEEGAIAKAIDEIYAHGPELRQLRFMRDLLGGGRRPEPGDLPSRLDPFIFDGEHAWLFDNREDELDFNNRVLGFDMTELLEDRRLRTPVLLYLFHRIEQRLDGSPTMILIDEAWKALDDPLFAARIRNWMKTLRKRNAMIGFATQSAADALDSSISSAIVEQTATAIFMPNTKAREEHYCQGFGLSAQEFEFIRSLPAHSRCFLVRQANRSVVVRLDLNGMPDVLTVLSGRESSVRRLDEIRGAVGNDPAVWYPMLTRTPWPGSPASDDYWLAAAE
ncbi:VirB4 family type IV secretion/conjugal transfer ATPase [Sphingomonas flavescens]|uniref:VirB4 family type IV secretion/conjugal transfer ATPase n=1 Tax=Sphingomonas flavescens TaxID=3132797 RepID=UPI0028045EBD|nr:VirB4 family type IV secretion/conjugal transfer ATPase [Sphingomonas limnosediminicola]